MLLMDGQSLVDLKNPKRGKVREIYDLGSSLLLVATDRISAFDVVMANGIPDKGKILNQMSIFWFEKLASIGPHHLVSYSNEDLRAIAPNDWQKLTGRSAIVRKTKPLPVECIARGYITGSLYKEYMASGGRVHGLELPDGLLDGSKLPEPIFTPATKAESGHDENISFNQMVDLVGGDAAAYLRSWTLRLYQFAAGFAESKGLILADTKFEFGEDNGELIWIDEALTPDSSRYWEATSYAPGRAQPSFDKQYVRDYLETINWDKKPPGPTLPDQVVDMTRAKYLDAYRRIVGKDLNGSTV